MKAIAINGSPNKDGNTYHALMKVGDELEKNGIEFEIIHIGNKSIRGCLDCGQCIKNKNEKCALEADGVNECIQKMKDAEGLILSSPVFFAGIAGTMKSFVDRVFFVSSVNGGLFRHKVGASIVADRRAGGISTFDQLNNYLTYSEMFLPSSNYWNVTYGTAPGEVEQDIEGMQIARILGKNMAWLLQTTKGSSIKRPTPEEKILYNYIR